VHPLREQHEYAVREAAERERAAWRALEAANRPDAEPTLLEARRVRWQTEARALVSALIRLKRTR